MSSHVALTFRCSSNFYRRSIQGFSQIAALLTSILKTSRITKSTTRPGKGGVGVGGDSGDDGGHDNGATFSMLRTSSSTNSSTSTTQITVEYDGVDVGDGKWVKESSKSRKTSKARKVAKTISSEERLPKHQSSVGSWIRRTRALVEISTVFRALFAGLRSSLDTTFGAIIDKAKVVELLMLYCGFSQRNEEDFRAKNARILCRL